MTRTQYKYTLALIRAELIRLRAKLIVENYEEEGGVLICDNQIENIYPGPSKVLRILQNIKRPGSRGDRTNKVWRELNTI